MVGLAHYLLVYGTQLFPMVTNTMQTIIFDLDGTLADASHRIKYIQNKPKDWNTFFNECINDQPIDDNISLLNLFWRRGHHIVIVSGRSDQVRTETIQWLNRHNVPFHNLFMRKAGDYRPDWAVKRDILHTELKNANIKCVFDDRDQVVNMWRNEGLRCYQVANGDF